MKKILLDNNVVNHLINEKYEETDLYLFFADLLQNNIIEIYAIPTNIIEISLCSDIEKRHSLAKVFLKLISGKRLEFSWDVQLIDLIFTLLNEEIPGVLKRRESLYSLSVNYNRMLLGLLGLLAALPEYETRNFESLLHEKLINEYYQVRFLTDPDYYLKIYKRQLNNEQPSSEDLDEQLYAESLSASDLKKEISRLRETTQKISNIKEFSKIKKELGSFFANYEAKRLILNFFPYKEILEESIDIRLLVNNWSNKIHETEPLHLESNIKELFKNPDSNPSKEAYIYMLLKLVDRLKLENYFPFKNILAIYLNEFEKIANLSKEPSKGLIYDIEYFPTALKADHFLTADKELYENTKREIKLLDLSESKVLFYHNKNWREDILK
ncbi:hypothetical protein [Leptospira levettii]|uniref:hypothetical protein n=1 Tax=Leptospira levettii TaxID=2023178 RepID=UPI003EBE26EA